MSELQQQVQKVVDELVASGAERGVQVAVYQDGEQVVDVVAGVADPATGRPVDPGTVFYNYSIGKAATSTVVHRLAERGLFGYDTYTFGYILGEVVRRVTGKRISQVLAEEVAEPLGVAGELWFGMPAAEHYRLAPLEDEPGAAEMAAQMLASMPPDLPMLRSAPMSLFPNASFGNRPDT